jgi:hypothetical protein
MSLRNRGRSGSQSLSDPPLDALALGPIERSRPINRSTLFATYPQIDDAHIVWHLLDSVGGHCVTRKICERSRRFHHAS